MRGGGEEIRGGGEEIGGGPTRQRSRPDRLVWHTSRRSVFWRSALWDMLRPNTSLTSTPALGAWPRVRNRQRAFSEHGSTTTRTYLGSQGHGGGQFSWFYMSVCLSVCLPVCLSSCVPVCVSVSLCVCVSSCPSVCLSVYMYVSRWAWPTCCGPPTDRGRCS